MKRRPAPPPPDTAGSKSDASSLQILDPEQRLLLFPTHPIVSGRFQIPTPPVRRTFDIITQTTTAGIPSCTFVGSSRFGKSEAAEYCKVRLPEAFPHIPIELFCAHDQAHMRRNNFYYDLLQQSGYLWPRSSHRDPASALARAWWVRCQPLRAPILILIIDEAHRLTGDSLSWLIDVANDLQLRNIRMVSILFGNYELRNLRRTLVRHGRTDIVGRFMSKMYSFDGISSAVELREVLQAYDDPTVMQYPADSDWCFTRFFFPTAYEGGFRLSACAEKLWDAFRSLGLPRLKSPLHAEQLNVGMQWVVVTIHHALMHYPDVGPTRFRISQSDWKEAIDASGWVQTLGLTYDPSWGQEP
jgi:hypothetical protein